MALSESGLLSQGVYPGPMIYGPDGQRKVVRPKKGPAKASTAVRGGRKQSLYVRPRRSK